MSECLKTDNQSSEISAPYERTPKERAAMDAHVARGKNPMTKKQASRPSVFTEELADQICDQLASGMTLRDVCRAKVMPNERTVRRWALDNKEAFAEKYSRAREIGYLSMADEMLEIADDGSNDWMLRQHAGNQSCTANGEHIQRSRLRLDTRKWTSVESSSENLRRQISGREQHPAVDGGALAREAIRGT